MGMNKSRGMETREVVRVLGSMWRIIVTSLLAPPTCWAEPKAEVCFPFRTALELDPTIKMFIGWLDDA